MMTFTNLLLRLSADRGVGRLGAMALVVLSIAGGTALAQPQTSQQGQWQVTEQTSAIDSTHSYAATLLAQSEVTNLIDHPEKPVLGLHCDAKGLFLSIIWPDTLENPTASFRLPVPYRADDAKPGSESWIAGDHYLAKQGTDALAWLNANAKVHTLVVRVPDHHGGQEASFQLDGLDAIDAKLKSMSCG